MKAAYSQQTPSSTPNDDGRRAALVAALERTQTEVKAARRYIDGLNDQVKSKQALIDKLNERDGVRVAIQTQLEGEIKNLRLAIAETEEALRIKTDEAKYLKDQLAKTNRKLRNSHTREKIFAAVAAILAGVLVLK